MKTATIRKIAFSGKWMEIWLDGLPYDKKGSWDDEKGEHYKTNEDNWNFSCKPYMFANWYGEIKDDLDEILCFNGWNYFIGKSVETDGDRLFFN